MPLVKTISIYPSDLSLETLLLIQRDMANYSHLAAYRQTWEVILWAIEEAKSPSEKRGIGHGRNPVHVTGGCPKCGYRHPPDGMCLEPILTDEEIKDALNAYQRNTGVLK